MDSKSLTTKEVARLCRVSDATVKRWESAGLIRSERTSGGHRRFRAEEIARFQQEQELGVRHSHGDESAVGVKVRRHADKSLSECTFFQALLAGCEDEAGNRLINEHLDGRPVTGIFDELISPTMRKIGRLWYEGKLSVAREHLATHTVQAALYKLRSVLPVSESCNRLAVCCAFEGDLHELPVDLVQMTLESEGWEVMNFGPNTPLFSLAEEIGRHSPELVCISSTLMDNIERAARDYEDFRQRTSKKKFRILLGGRTFTDEAIRARFPADAYPDSFSQVAGIARRQAG